MKNLGISDLFWTKQITSKMFRFTKSRRISEALIACNSQLLRTTAWMQEVEQRMEQLPTTAWMQEVEQRMEQLPRFAMQKLGILGVRCEFTNRSEVPLMIVATLMAGSVLSGCTNYLYQGTIKAEDSEGKQREVVLYWSKTDPFIGYEKADMANLLIECSNTVVVFENQPQGIIFRGEPQRDRVVKSPAATASAPTDNIECGRIQGVNRLTELVRGKVSLTIQCEPISDEFSAQKRTYLKARKAAYVFEITESKNWSFMGSTPDAPPRPVCRE